MIFKASCAAMAGTAHRQTGTPCQDSVRIHRENGILCAALADGAGSRPASHRGSDQATRLVCRLLCTDFDELYAKAPMAAAQDILAQCLAGLNSLPEPMYDLASTLLFFAADDRGRFLSGHLGDGVQILVNQNAAQVFSPPENGEDPAVTWFLTSPDALEHFRITAGVLPDHSALLMMSDGMAAGLYRYDTREPARACATIARWLREEPEDVVCEALQENMQQLFSHKSADDLSLAVICW